MPLAGAAMLHVAKTPNSKPEVPQGPELDDNPEDANEEDLANLDSQTPVGDLADQAAANSDEVETLTLKDDELPDDNTDKPKTKDELIIIALQQRIGEMAMQYEGAIASLRADLTQLQNVLDVVNGDTTSA
jgi:hypothetical protein